MGGFAFRQFAGLIHPQDDFVGIPIAPHVHDQGEAESDNDPRLAAQSASENDDEAGKQASSMNVFSWLVTYVFSFGVATDPDRLSIRFFSL